MKIEIFTDFACPFCYIGKKRLAQAIEQVGIKDVEFVYKAYQLYPEESKNETTSFSETGLSAEHIEAIIMQAKEVGLDYELEKVQMGNTENAHRLAKWAKTKGRESEFIEETFHRYFTKGLNVNEMQQLLDIVEHVGLPVEEAKAVWNNPDAFQEQLAQDRYDIQQIPVTSVPFFVFENRFGIKGVEPLEVFTKTLDQTKNYLQQQAPSLVMQGDTGASCSIDGCE
ncbi:DsbA family oxidoreductase [Kurthia massiliensis]|uniref:DsbA family oxidoreductase n=1 Tax=Kurthia massiliensis TaxID=1033739 RepID=UPI000287C4FF|nr:DsbA family oxidoreductase [Kurthia massiliensis]